MNTYQTEKQFYATHTPVIILETVKPINGYWDGGAKSYFKFEPDLMEDKKGTYVKWGSWSANFWFTCGYGKSWKQAASIAKQMLERKYISKTPATIRIEWKEIRQSED